MTNPIFKSLITLCYSNEYHKAKYQEQKFLMLRKVNIILSTLLLSLSLAITVPLIYWFLRFLPQDFIHVYITSFSIPTLTLNITTLLLCILIKHNRLQEWVTYLNYILIFPLALYYRYFIINILELDIYVFFLLFVSEMIIRMMWFMLGCIGFKTGVYLHIITMILKLSLFSIITPNEVYYRTSIYNIILICVNLLSYFYCKERKISFYYNIMLKLKNEWYKNIIDNMNSGFISIRDGQVEYCNKTLLGYIQKGHPRGGGSELHYLNSFNLDELFKDIQYENGSIDSFNQITGVLKENHSQAGDSFIFIGYKDLEVPNSDINLEVFGRCYSSCATDKYEFIFNDITRTKQIEQKNAEFKYKTLFLSKVAHEFKNPLLCIEELVEQVCDLIKQGGIVQILDLLMRIKSMSYYLIILVKDMDFFSRKVSGAIEHKVELERVDLNKIILFCKHIVISLLKKVRKDNSIEFQILTDILLPKYINTDEVKLKQILINLLSNSVKYTQQGYIRLRVTRDGDMIKFQIDDTGKGLSEGQKQNLFIPFSNQYDKLNTISSGLGLSIVKELAETLGSKIEYESIQSKGSSFWFYLPVSDEPQEEVNDKTIVGDYFSEIPIRTRLSSISKRDLIPIEKVNIIVIDDEHVTRKATIRLLERFLLEKMVQVNIIEASDGIEGLYSYYSLMSSGKRLAFILSDESMVYMNGSTCARILHDIEVSKNMPHVMFYILSAYENFDESNIYDGVFTKPLRRNNIEEIIKKVNK
jgi:signal transduction histidine kinase